MSILGHETETVVPEATGLSEEMLNISQSYTGSLLDGNGFKKDGTKIQTDPEAELKRYIRQAEPAPAPAPEPLPIAPLRTEVPSFDPIRPEKGIQNENYLWPGETSLMAGERPTVEPKRRFNFSAGEIALSGLKKRALGLIESARARVAHTSIDLEPAKMSLAATKGAVQKHYEWAKGWAIGEEHQQARRKVGVVAGGLAVAATVGYLEHKGLMPSIHTSGVKDGAETAAAHRPATNQAAGSLMQPLLNVPKPAQEVTDTLKHTAKQPHYQIEQLRFYGDTLWAHAQFKLQATLGHKPDLSQLNSYVKRALKFNNLNWHSARYMREGQHFKLPAIRR